MALPDWIHINQVTGNSGETSILITTNPNTSGEERSYTLTISGGSEAYGTASTQVLIEQDFIPIEEQYLTFEIESDGYLGWTVRAPGNVSKYIQYSLNDGDWTTIHSDSLASSNMIYVSQGDKVRFKGSETSYYGSCWGASSAYFKVKGNIMSLLYGDNFIGQTTIPNSSNTFSYFFASTIGTTITKGKVTDASQLVLPATALTPSCYEAMFRGCTGLTLGPALPATVLAENCYKEMFSYCYGLLVPPALPATELERHCYQGMFTRCYDLLAPPTLPATNLGYGCYVDMCCSCTTLTTISELPATALTPFCYAGMFRGCTGLIDISTKLLPATELATNCYSEMFARCTKLSKPPILPATTLVGSCYTYMFAQCSALTSLICLATDISVSSSTYNWVVDTPSTGVTFTKAASTTWPSGPSGIPSGWTVIDA